MTPGKQRTACMRAQCGWGGVPLQAPLSLLVSSLPQTSMTRDIRPDYATRTRSCGCAGLQSPVAMRSLHPARHSSHRPSDGTHTVLRGAADYKWSLRGLEGGALEAELRRCHLRSADRMVKVAGRNGGVYIKAGQHLGQMVGAVVELLLTARAWPCGCCGCLPQTPGSGAPGGAAE